MYLPRSLLVLSTVLFCALAGAQDYPSKPVRLLVPFSAGGPTDLVARVFADKLKDRLGQQVIVENRPGGGTLVATEAGVRAAPDGYTVLFSTSSKISAAELNPPPYDIYRDLVPVVHLGELMPLLLIANRGVPGTSFPDLVAYAKKNPGALACGNSGFGNPAYIFCELVRRRAGIELTPVSYKGQAEMMKDLLGGRIHLMFSTAASVRDFLKSGELRLLGATGDQRSPEAPELPTLAELGMQGVALPAWFGLEVPTGTPRAAIARLDRESEVALKDPQLAERMKAAAFHIRYLNGADFAAQLKRDAERVSRILDETGVKAQALRDAGIKKQ